jgi:ubiquinone/menaquinone biosynthesis C-methylase UbiE
MSPVSKDIEQYYLKGTERDRLVVDRGELEKVRTQSILDRFLPKPPAIVLDVGGAAGVYAFPLAEAGYEVHLIDPMELHLEQARQRSSESGVRLASIRSGDARQLEIASDSADGILLFGPLYHLTERSDRLSALSEAHRILKRDGVVFAAAISRFASLIDGLLKGRFQDPEFRKIVSDDLASGQHRNLVNYPGYFTTAYFHRADELAAEVADAGFDQVEVRAVEGVAWSAARFEEVWSSQVEREALLQFLALIEQEPSILGASAHFIAVGRKNS